LTHEQKIPESVLPNQDIAIDESLTLCKGSLSCEQYIPLKAAKFGIKSHKLSESGIGYVWFFIIYTEQGTELTNQSVNSDTNKTAADQICGTSLGSRSHTLDGQFLYFSRVSESAISPLQQQAWSPHET
jgi:hypothetical protein